VAELGYALLVTVQAVAWSPDSPLDTIGEVYVPHVIPNPSLVSLPSVLAKAIFISIFGAKIFCWDSGNIWLGKFSTNTNVFWLNGEGIVHIVIPFIVNIIESGS